jgi:hypothetical protein
MKAVKLVRSENAWHMEKGAYTYSSERFTESDQGINCLPQNTYYLYKSVGTPTSG